VSGFKLYRTFQNAFIKFFGCFFSMQFCFLCVVAAGQLVLQVASCWWQLLLESVSAGFTLRWHANQLATFCRLLTLMAANCNWSSLIRADSAVARAES